MLFRFAYRWLVPSALVLGTLAPAQAADEPPSDCYHWFINTCMLVTNSPADVGMALVAGRESGALVEYYGCSGPATDFPELGIVQETLPPQAVLRELRRIEEQFDLPEALVGRAKGVFKDDDPRFATGAELRQYIHENYGKRAYAGFRRYAMRLRSWSAKKRAEFCALGQCGNRHADCAIEHSEARPQLIFVDDGTPGKRYLVVARSTAMESLSLSDSANRQSEQTERVENKGGRTVEQTTTGSEGSKRTVTTTSPQTNTSEQTTGSDAASTATSWKYGENELHYALSAELSHEAEKKEFIEALFGTAVRVLQQCMAGKQLHCEIDRVLRNFGRPIRAPSKEDLLRNMVIQANVSAVSWLLEAYAADPNSLYRSGDSVLHRAVRKQHGELARLLINAGADVNIADSTGRSVLYEAAKAHNLALFAQLLQAGADPNSLYRSGDSVLHWAVRKQHGELVRLLINAGADVNIADSTGRSVLYEAAKAHNLALFAQLLQAGADPNRARSKFGMPLLHVIAQSAALGDRPASMELLSTLLQWAEDERNQLDFYARDRSGKLVHEVFWDSCPFGREVRRRLSEYVPPPLDPSVYRGVEGACETMS